MVDNFETIEKLLKFEEPGDCYYVQLLRRQSDDPLVDGMPDPAYHGNMHSRSIKDYFISSVENLEQRKADIIKLCETFNVRAYIRLNKRNYKQICLHMLKHIAEQEISGQSFASPFHIVASAAGIANCASKGEKTWIVDLDTEYSNHNRAIREMICKCDPIDSDLKAAAKRLAAPNDVDELYQTMLENEMEKFTEIKTKNGRHLIVHPFNKAKFAQLWEEYVVKNEVTSPLPLMKMTDINFTFSLTGPYLKYADSLLAICQSVYEAKSERIDQNKVMIHVQSDYVVDSKKFEKIMHDWKQWCKISKFWLRAPDIHKDNPTILYVP